MVASATTMNPRLMELDGKAIFSPDDTTSSDEMNYILDSSWAKSAFLINDEQFDDQTDIKNRYWSSANAKYTDTRLGCNIGINPKPQFNRYSDIRNKGRLGNRQKVSLANSSGNFGMGRYYSEAIDDPSQTIYMRFGVPQFNSLMSFLFSAYNSDLTTLARTGRASSTFYNLAKAAGTITTVVAFPMFAAVVAGAKLINWVFGRSTSKFYTMKPAMHLYWSTVSSLVNNIAVSKGLFPKSLNTDADEAQRLGQPYKIDADHLKQLTELMPGVFDNGYFDMYSIANQAQRLSNQVFKEDYAALSNGTASDYEGYLKKEMTGTGSHTTYLSNKNGKPSLSAWLSKVASLSYFIGDSSNPQIEQDPRVNDTGTDPQQPTANKKKDPSFFSAFASHFDSEFDDGSQFAIFKVDHTGPVSEAFANAVQESDISQKINGATSAMRQAKFSFADGNIVGGAVGAVVGAAKDVVEGAIDGLSFGFSSLVKGLAGGGYIDIPKHWQSSSATLPRSTYTFTLISVYGNIISHMQDIYIPLSMILAGTLPLSVGNQAYSSPFLCQIFDRGRCQVKLGMIESLTITRGTSNLAFNLKGNALAIEVSFNVVDLSTLMHMPISTGGLFSAESAFDEDNILTDYIATLSGQDLYTQMYAMPKAKLKLAAAMMNAKKLSSPAYWASTVHDSLKDSSISGPVISTITNVLEGVRRGAGTANGPING